MANDLSGEIRSQFPEIVVVQKGDDLGFLNAKDIDEIDKNGGADDIVLYFAYKCDSALRQKITSFVRSIRPDAVRVIFHYWYT